MSDNIFQEIDDSVREERLLKFWQAYQNYIYGAVGAILIATAGYIFWRQHVEHRNAERAMTYLEVSNQLAFATTDGEIASATEAADEFLKNNSHEGYGALMTLKDATFLTKTGRIPEAIALLKNLSETRSAGEVIRDLALVRWGYLVVAHAPTPEDARAVMTAMRPLLAPTSAWNLAALEITGYAALSLGDAETAEHNFQELLTQALAKNHKVRVARARIMLDYLSSKGAS